MSMSDDAFVLGDDIPDDEILLDSAGRPITDAYVDAAVEDAIATVRRGRPSLSESGESPLLRVRVSADLEAAVTSAAAQAGTTRSEWIRRVLTAATTKEPAADGEVRFVLGPDIPDDEIVYDSAGRPLTDAYVDEIVAEVHDRD